MKLYTFKPAPNPRRVHLFLAEKGIEIEDQVEVRIRENENLEASFLAVNPFGTVPVLELDDGTRLTESLAICRYFEALQPDPPLFGSTPLEKALVENWHRRVEIEGMQAVGEALRNKAPRFEKRGVPAPFEVRQIPALVDRGLLRARHWFEGLDRRLGESRYVAGDFFSMADISAYVTVGFAKVVELAPLDSHANTARWRAEIDARPSGRA